MTNDSIIGAIVLILFILPGEIGVALLFILLLIYAILSAGDSNAFH